MLYDMLINIKTNKYMIKKKKKKKNTSVRLYLGKWECLNMLNNQRAYTATTNTIAFVEKFLTIHVGGSLVCCNIYSLFTENRNFVTLYIVNDET